jgi:hypothetical protein
LKDNDQVAMSAFAEDPESLRYASPRLQKIINGGKRKKKRKTKK